MDYQILRQSRKTISLSVTDELNVVVKAPSWMSEKYIDDFVRQHEAWIEKALELKQEKKQNDFLKRKAAFYLGKEIPITVRPAYYQKEKVILTDKGFIIITHGDEKRQHALLEAYYKEAAKEYLTTLSNFYAQMLGVSFKRVTIRKQKTRWGSCSSKGTLSYNLKVMCAPQKMIAYVALHEVMHLKHFDHSKAFWNDIEKIMPDYKERMNYFKIFGQNFMI